MVVDFVGQQVRIREHSPSIYSKLRTQELGRQGRLQRIAGYSKSRGWETQAWRLNLEGYSDEGKAISDLNKIRTSPKHKAEAKRIIRRYFR